MSASELREREDFVIESTTLLRDRLLMHPVFERLGWDVDLRVEWAKRTTFMIGFRQMTFSKIRMQFLSEHAAPAAVPAAGR